MNVFRGCKQAAMAACVLVSAVPFASAQQVEVVHWWTSGGEAAALKVMVEAFTKSGGQWKDSPVAGGEAARMVARTRILGGNPPTAMQWFVGKQLIALAEEKLLNGLPADVTKDWDKALPKEISDISKYNGAYVAAPVNIHARNWLWANKEVLASVGADIPKSWKELFALAPKLKEKGLIPLAVGGQSWQELIIFETMVLEVGGMDMYKKVVHQLDDATLGSDKMVEVFKLLDNLRGIVDQGSAGRDWNITTALMTGGKAAMMVMGDWAKAEFAAAKKVPGKDLACTLFPADSKAFVFTSDAFAMTATKDAALVQGQNKLAGLLMDPAFQATFSKTKGSIPARSDAPRDGFDPCSTSAMELAYNGKLVPTGDLASDPTGWGAVQDSVTAFLHSKMTPEEGAKKLREAVAAAR